MSPGGESRSGQGAPADALIGKVLEGRYRIDAAVGRGAMGSVYRGVHLLMERTVALKVLRPDLAVDPTAARRFVREAKSTFRFDQEHCVRVTDFGATPDGILYLVMEYLQGTTVWDALQAAPLASRRIAHIARQVCEALAHAHSLGFVHRDLKPDNIMLVRRGGDPDFVKVLDFGLAKIFDADAAGGGTLMSVLGLTQEGSVFGTPAYMSPEQAQGAPLDPRTDIYSLGVAMYEMATGLAPFDAAATVELLAMQVRAAPVPPRARRPDLGIAPELEAIILACLEKRAEARPQSAAELAARLAELERSLPAAAAPPPRVSRRVASQPTEDLPAAAAPARATLRGAAAPANAAFAAAAPAHVGATAAPAHVGATAAPAHVGATAAPAHPSIATPAVPESGVSAAAAPARSGRRWAIAAAAGAAVVAVALWVATRPVPAGKAAAAAARNPSANGPASAHAASPAPAPRAAAPAHVGSAAPAANAAPGRGPARPAVAATTASAPADAASAGGHARARARAERRRKLVRRHLRAAEAAQKRGNPLKELAEADTALRLDSRDRRAAYLVGDALVKSGDVKNGCRYLRRARALKAARAAARRAGCAAR